MNNSYFSGGRGHELLSTESTKKIILEFRTPEVLKLIIYSLINSNEDSACLEIKF